MNKPQSIPSEFFDKIGDGAIFNTSRNVPTIRPYLYEDNDGNCQEVKIISTTRDYATTKIAPISAQKFYNCINKPVSSSKSALNQNGENKSGNENSENVSGNGNKENGNEENGNENKNGSAIDDLKKKKLLIKKQEVVKEMGITCKQTKQKEEELEKLKKLKKEHETLTKDIENIACGAVAPTSDITNQHTGDVTTECTDNENNKKITAKNNLDTFIKKNEGVVFTDEAIKKLTIDTQKMSTNCSVLIKKKNEIEKQIAALNKQKGGKRHTTKKTKQMKRKSTRIKQISNRSQKSKRKTKR